MASGIPRLSIGALPRHGLAGSSWRRNRSGSRLPGWGLFWLAAGGLAYTAGVGFYAASRLRYRHFVWHLFVLAGTACHVVAVSLYAI